MTNLIDFHKQSEKYGTVYVTNIDNQKSVIPPDPVGLSH